MRRRAVPLWQPTSHAGLALWLDASDLATLDLQSGVVANWYDKSPAARTLTQGTAAARPAWSATGLASSRPGVTFDGTDDFLTGSPFMYAANGCTAFLVAAGGSIGTNDYVVGEGNSASNNSTYAIFKSSTSTASTVHSQIINDANTTILNNTPSTTLGWQAAPQLLVRLDSGSSMGQRLNGVVGGTANYTRSGTMTLDLLTIGARSRATPVNHAPCTIAEVVVFARTMELGEVERVEGYLRGKWNLTLNADHPWSTRAPR